MTGLELLEKIKSKFFEIMVSMISGYGDGENYKKALSFGTKQFFPKLIDLESLKNEIRQLQNYFNKVHF